MSGSESSTKIKLPIIGLLLLGIITVISSAFFLSSFFATVGLCLVFWSSLLIYLIPSKHESSILLEAVSDPISANIELLIKENNLNNKGVYLASNFHNNRFLSSIRSGPITPDSTIVLLPDKTLELYTSGSDSTVPKSGGVRIAPPGEGLCKALEHQAGQTFKSIKLEEFSDFIDRALKHSKLAQSVETQIQKDLVTVEILETPLARICQETNKYMHTHSQVGCLLSSAIACALAVVTAKPVFIEKEILNPKSNYLQIQLRVLPKL